MEKVTYKRGSFYDRMAGVVLWSSDSRWRRDGVRQGQQYGVTDRRRHFGDIARGLGGGDDERLLLRRLVDFIDRRSASAGQVRVRGAVGGVQNDARRNGHHPES